MKVVVNGIEATPGRAVQNWGELLAALDDECAGQGVVVTEVTFDGVAQPSFREPEMAEQPIDALRIEVDTARQGDLAGLPFRRGVRQDGRINGGMPADFRLEDNGLAKLKVAVKGGVVFASFDQEVEDFDSYLGEVRPWFERAAIVRARGLGNLSRGSLRRQHV